MKPIIKWGHFILGEERESGRWRFTLKHEGRLRLQGLWCSGQLHVCLLSFVFRDEGTQGGITAKLTTMENLVAESTYPHKTRAIKRNSIKLTSECLPFGAERHIGIVRILHRPVRGRHILNGLTHRWDLMSRLS